MKSFLTLLLVVLSVTIQAQAIRAWRTATTVYLADSANTTTSAFKAKSMVVDAPGTAVRVYGNGLLNYYAPAKFLNQAGQPWSTVSAAAAVTAFQNSAVSSGGGSGTGVAGVNTVNGQSGNVTITIPTNASQVGAYTKNETNSLVSGLNGLGGLTSFLTKAINAAPSSQIPIKIVGNSIAYGTNTVSYYAATAIARQYGTSQSQYINPVSGPAQGWLQQYYSGTGSIRLRGSTTQGASGITKGVQAASFTIYYSTEPDGGQMGISIQSGTGTAVVQTPISCVGSSSYGNAVTYLLDPTQQSLIVISPPTTGFAYWEGYYVDQGDQGIVVQNTAWGGSALGNHAGTLNRPAGSGMAATATPSGNKGLLATFAPAKAPGLLIFGPILTNDTGDPAFATNVDAAITAAVGNGSSVLAIIEPINAQVSLATWNTMRAAIYAAQAKFPTKVWVYDWDRFMSPDGSFNPAFHNSDLNDPHPGTYAAGDPHVLAAHDLLYRLNIPFPSNLPRAIARDNLNFANLAPLASPRFTGAVGINSSTMPVGVIFDVQGNVRFGTPGSVNSVINISGTLKLTENTGGLSTVEIGNSSPSGVSSLVFSNSGAGGKAWSIDFFGNNAQGGNGTAPKENRIIWRRSTDDALALTMGITVNGPVYNPTANWHLAPSTSSAASLRIPGGSAPTSPNEGDIWKANERIWFRRVSETVLLDDNGGKATFSGNGSTLTFSIPHGLGYTPQIITLEAGSAAAANIQFRSADATNVIATYTTAPVSGTNNVILYWTAK